MRASLSASLRGVLLLSLPATLGLILLRKPLIVLLYQRGEFTSHSTELVAWALAWYAAGLVAHSVVEVLVRAFYAMHDTKTPVLIGTGAMTLNVVFSISFSSLFARFSWMPHGGLALANTLATALEMLGLIFVMSRRLNGIEGKRVLTGAGQALLATAGMSLALWGWLVFAGHAPAWLLMAGGLSLGVGVYAGVIWGLGVGEARQLSSAVLARLKEMGGY
jgi:putative peptidoglycan lipid II flippase